MGGYAEIKIKNKKGALMEIRKAKESDLSWIDRLEELDAILND